MTTRLVLVTILSRKTSYFGDETYSRHHFELKNTFFGDETYSRHHFELKNTLF
ncbi:hypothetical protein NST17_12305 [Caldifermentibacillus hisashii]|uniref:Uncharacterized protein n=1 Tax=Caldifermentibacillus hisashii TaxID=996558 RepID=A0ABU9JYN6_9BACI